MRLGQVVLRLRAKQTRFGNYIGGAAEMDAAIQRTLTKDMAFVVPVSDEGTENSNDNSINQVITERFGVMVAIQNDSTQSDKLGFKANDLLHDIRSEFFRSLLGWTPLNAESLVYYRRGFLVDINNGYLWYMFEFEYKSRILQTDIGDPATFVGGASLQESDFDDTEMPTDFDTLYMQLIKTPDARIPYENSFGEDGEMPYPDGFPDVALPNMANWIDFTENPNAGAFGKGFASGFDKYKGT